MIVAKNVDLVQLAGEPRNAAIVQRSLRECDELATRGRTLRRRMVVMGEHRLEDRV